jgi:hypothetical protein
MGVATNDSARHKRPNALPTTDGPVAVVVGYGRRRQRENQSVTGMRLIPK